MDIIMKSSAVFYILLLAVLLLNTPVGAAQRYAKDDVLVVLSKTGLAIREKADARAKVLVIAPCGAQVTMEDEPAAAALAQEGIAGGWARIAYNDISGFAFDGLLGRMRAPEEGCEGLEAYFNDHFKSSGSPVEKTETGEGGEEKIVELAFSNGATIRHRELVPRTGGMSRRVSVYTLPGIDRIEEVFLVLRLLGYIDPGFPFPAKSGRAGVTRNGSVVRATVVLNNNQCQSLELVFRRPDIARKKIPDIDMPGLVIRRQGEGITIEMRNLKR